MTRNRWSLKVGTTSGQQWRQLSAFTPPSPSTFSSLFPNRYFLHFFSRAVCSSLCLLLHPSLFIFIFSIFSSVPSPLSLPFHSIPPFANPFFTSFSSISVHSSSYASSSSLSSPILSLYATFRQGTHKPRPDISTKFAQGQEP